jgi:hypothetical protein
MLGKILARLTIEVMNMQGRNNTCWLIDCLKGCDTCTSEFYESTTLNPRDHINDKWENSPVCWPVAAPTRLLCFWTGPLANALEKCCLPGAPKSETMDAESPASKTRYTSL